MLMALAALPAGAQSLSGIKVEPAAAKVGEPVKITGTFDSAGNPNCNLRVEFGDGKSQNFKINQEKDVPLVTTHTYAKAGTYKVSILPRTALPMIKCQGADQSATVTVQAMAPVATAMPAGKPVSETGPNCPEGWKLDAKSVNKKTGSFTCSAKRGTALPSARIECPAPLGYFENRTKGRLGCQP
jgi:uncharacterized protein involved in outer membrane biogenesis